MDGRVTGLLLRLGFLQGPGGGGVDIVSVVRIGVWIGRSLITENLNLTSAPLPSRRFPTPSDCQRPPYLLDVVLEVLASSSNTRDAIT